MTFSRRAFGKLVFSSFLLVYARVFARTLDLVEYGGARPYDIAGAHFTDEALAKCKRDLPAAGGRILLPNVTLYHERPIDLTDGPQTLWLDGEGPNASVFVPLFTGEDDGMKVARAGGKFMRVSNLSIIAGDGTRPSDRDIDPRRPVRNGIVARGGSGGGFNSLVLDHVEARGFQGHACLIEGATGPVRIRDSQFQACAGVGLRMGLSPDGDTPPQDVVMDGGNIQDCDGGIDIDGANAVAIKRVDIELQRARKPCVAWGTGATANSVCYGGSMENVTCTIAEGPAGRPSTADCAVRVRNTQGLHIFAGMNFALNGGHNYLFEDGRLATTKIKIEEGFYVNGAHLGHHGGFFGMDRRRVIGGITSDVSFNGGTYDDGHMVVSRGV